MITLAEPKMTTKPHSAISPTAKLVAHLRALCGITYAGEIAAQCDAESAYRAIVGEHDVKWVAPLIERRHLAINAALDRAGCLNVLELAAGLSPRGLLMTERNPDGLYLETDLTDMIAEKARVVAGILGGEFSRRHQFRVLNAVNPADFSRAMTGFFPDDEPLAVICEGLLPYLSRDAKAGLACSVLNVLRQRPGSVWITTDILTIEKMERMAQLEPNMRKIMESIFNVTGCDLEANAFESLPAAQEFFQTCGFAVRRFLQAELAPKLASVQKISVDPMRIYAMSKDLEVWVMRVPE